LHPLSVQRTNVVLRGPAPDDSRQKDEYDPGIQH
jgi:hypothetical protein